MPDTELIWPDKKTEVDRIILPFQTVEVINEPREKQKRLYENWPENYPKDWKNMLIWGDNKYIMSSLLPKFAGKIKLIYIDPPFATGADFSINMKVGDVSWTKEPNIIEERAYRDTWGKGLSSYLQMLYERLVLMKDLLAEDGSIYVHLDWRVDSYVRILMDEIFSRENFRNEIVWCYRTMQTTKSGWARKHDIILYYIKTDNYIFNLNDVLEPYPEDYQRRFKYVDEQGRRFMIRGKGGPFGVGQGDISIEDEKKYPEYTYRQYMQKGSIPKDWWEIDMLNSNSKERVGFPTQKPEALLERIIKASSNEGDIVADFFCGSGTTLAVAEKLGRRWIGADLSKFAIHVTRKRMLDIPFCRPFEIYNLGSYQKYKFIENNHPPVERYIKFILELYRAQPLQGYAFIHGRKDRRVVHIAGVDSIVTEREVRDACEECANAIGGKALDVLGWDFEMGLDELIERIGQDYGINMRLVQIPKEAMELKSAKEEIRFYDMNYLEVEHGVNGKTLEIELKDFIIANPEYIPDEVREKIKKFTDYIDYWAVDFDYKNDTFHNMWQSFRTKKHPKLDTKVRKTYSEAGDYKVLIKVIDIFGNDTNKLLRVRIE
ncbi:MAG TPA: site-specific DNA-methyltransferase [Thermoplasmata archaeon]|nr:site-specific DNA-methyltransferase [Thermoplasmata archaeon]